MTIARLNKRSRKAREWAKIVTGIDSTQKGGHAVEGEWFDLDAEVELPDGTLILYVDGDRDAWLYRVSEGASADRATNLERLTNEDGDFYYSLHREWPTLRAWIIAELEATLDPREQALAEIARLMKEHGVKLEELSEYGE